MELLLILLDLADKKEIPYTKKQLEKMPLEKLEIIYEEYKKKELDEFNEAMTDVFISKLDEYFKKWEFIKEDSTLGQKLQNKKLFRKDLKSAISVLSPYLPFVGILEGGVCIISEVVDKMSEKPSGHEIPDLNKEDDVYYEESGDSGETQS